VSLSRSLSSDDRSVSPVVGAVLLLAIVVLLVGATATLVFGLAGEQDPAPTAKFTFEPTQAGDRYELTHYSGDRIDGDRLTIRGVADPATVDGSALVAGRTVEVLPRAETVRIVWRERSGDPSSYVLATFDVAPGDVVRGFGDGTVFTHHTAGVAAIEGDGGSVTTIPNTSDIEGMGGIGPDVSGDGTADIPYVDSSETVGVVDAEGEVTPLASSSDVSGSIATDKTRLATGRWNGHPPSVFFVDQNHDQLYRVAPGGSPQVVAAPGDGAQSVSGIGDVDGDGAAELVFAGGSQTLHYVDDTGTVEDVDDGQTGSNNGIGAGSLADFDGDGTVAIVAASSGNNLKINREPAGDGTLVLTAPDVAKAPVTTADVDGDDSPEVVYVSTSDRIEYVDDPFGAATVVAFSDETGSDVDGSKATGTT
jgi:flagellin-like protein